MEIMPITEMEHGVGSRTEVADRAGSERERLIEGYVQVRQQTERLCEPLENEDYVIQTSSDVSPAKWHLAHTTWFFETFLLAKYVKSYRPVREAYSYLFNSYYQAAGPRHARPQRGFLSRPTVKEVYAYRAAIDQRMQELLSGGRASLLTDLKPLVSLGLNHEQQHQELLLTDLKYNFAANPLMPAYRPSNSEEKGAGNSSKSRTLGWIPMQGGVEEIGHDGKGFAYDNELPRHRVFLEDFRIADRLITNAEFLEFVEAGGYRESRFWLADGWDWVERERIEAPLYWAKEGGEWRIFTLSGSQNLNPDEPVCHMSFYEADAFAAWKDCRLPTEAEWELAARSRQSSIESSNLLETDVLHPLPTRPETGSRLPAQMFGDVWEWTGSAYLPYPGFRVAPGALGEYNGKFMSGQMVLRGGSCVTPRSHIRASYRNFFQPDKRWQFTGIRLAADL
jgi:ergothioneine biosynthesis protein EgtB